jgi:hypothetical protein
VATLTSGGKNLVAESSINSLIGESYELRVYFNHFDLSKREPQIKTQIKVGSLFFAKSDSKSPEPSDTSKNRSSASPLYVASGALHISKDGKFTLEHTFLEWWSPVSNSTYFTLPME